MLIKAELKLFKKLKDELTVSDKSDIVVKSSRILVLTILREKAISLAHEGHQGIIKTKQLLREKVWLPGIDQLTKSMVQTCLACQANIQDSCPAPLQMSQLPPTAWHTLHINFCGPLVVIDAYFMIL